VSSSIRFTLIELFVVNANIAILAATIAPVFAQARAATSGTTFSLGHHGRAPLTVLETVGCGCAIFDFDGDGIFSSVRMALGTPENAPSTATTETARSKT
jgi:hypothetical protein